MIDAFIYERPAPYSSPAAKCALDVLGLLAERASALSTSEIARQLGASRSLTYRVLCELQRQHCVERANDRRYRLGLRVLELGGAYAAHSDFSQSVRSVLLELSQLTGETSNFAVLTGAEVLYMMKQEGENSIATISLVGTRLPATCSALGKVMLAQLPDRELSVRLCEPLPRSTPKSIGTMAELRRDLEWVRRHGYAVEHGESVTGRCCIAMLVRVPGQVTELSAMSVSMPEDVFAVEGANILSHLQKGRDRLNAESQARDRLEGITLIPIDK
jgi:DNA-binding IclR family transcriptional regulator